VNWDGWRILGRNTFGLETGTEDDEAPTVA
jgi:hypothetical protein